MGKSKSIEDQTALNDKFQAYIDQQTQVLDKTVAAATQTLDAQIEAYYAKGGWNDAKPMISGTYQHISTTSDWSLNAVADMIGQLKSTLFGGPPPGGTTAPAQPPDVSAAVAKLDAMEVLITDAAFTAIEGILQAFTSSTQTTVQSKTEVQVLAPGLTLFLAVVENQYSRSDFVSGETIIQEAYVFDTRFSIKQGGDIAKFNQLTSLIAQQTTQQDITAKCDKAIEELDVTVDDYDVKVAKYQGIVDRANAQVEVLQGEISKLEEKALRG